MPTLEHELVQQLIKLLDGGQAHATFDAAVKDFPESLHGTVPDNLPYSAWQIVEHIRIAQRDILDFCRNTDGSYEPLSWPEAYWPKEPNPPTKAAWTGALHHLREDRKAFDALLTAADAKSLTEPFPWGDGQNLLREALLMADHAAYHTGELIIIRRLLGIWKP
jgi:hypothetical protein